MPVIRTPAIICTVRRHGEHGGGGAVVHAPSWAAIGLCAGRAVDGPASGADARESRHGGAAQPGERSACRLTVELAESRAPFYSEPLAAAAFEWVTLLTATVAPEDQPFPRLYAALAALLDLVCAAPSARWWLRAMVRYEALLLAELGFGLDLERCAVTGERADLAYVSPRTGRAVSVHAAGVYAEKLLVLPAFLTGEEEPDWEQLMQGFALTGHFIERQFFTDRRADALAARAMLIDRVRRMAG
jgi:DNA repair protein RecO (recombination protein O)